MTAPIFILSLPRSGSTLLQRLIATHPAVATSSEPWLLLPLFLGFRDGHVFTNYRQRYLAQAFSEFLGRLPDGAEAHRAAVRRFAGTLYGRACTAGETHFLDKTPRYHLIAEELLQTFPDGRFILLWRNPLAVVSSCVETWARGRWYLHHWRVDLYHGLSNLVELRRRFGDRVFTLRYEDLVTEPDRYVRAIFQYLDLPPAVDAVERYREVRLNGNMGDTRGHEAYPTVSTASRDRWPAVLASPLRRAWARRYLRWLGRDRLAVMGYDPEELASQLAAQPRSWRSTLPDLVWTVYGRYAVAREPALFRRKRALARRGLRIDVASE
jgi:hypothetical protein